MFVNEDNQPIPCVKPTTLKGLVIYRRGVILNGQIGRLQCLTHNFVGGGNEKRYVIRLLGNDLYGFRWEEDIDTKDCTDTPDNDCGNQILMRAIEPAFIAVPSDDQDDIIIALCDDAPVLTPTYGPDTMVIPCPEYGSYQNPLNPGEGDPATGVTFDLTYPGGEFISQIIEITIEGEGGIPVSATPMVQKPMTDNGSGDATVTHTFDNLTVPDALHGLNLIITATITSVGSPRPTVTQEIPVTFEQPCDDTPECSDCCDSYAVRLDQYLEDEINGNYYAYKNDDCIWQIEVPYDGGVITIDLDVEVLTNCPYEGDFQLPIILPLPVGTIYGSMQVVETCDNNAVYQYNPCDTESTEDPLYLENPAGQTILVGDDCFDMNPDPFFAGNPNRPLFTGTVLQAYDNCTACEQDCYVITFTPINTATPWRIPEQMTDLEGTPVFPLIEIAELTVTESYPGASWTFELATGDGTNDADNAFFTIENGDKLQPTVSIRDTGDKKIYIRAVDGTATYPDIFCAATIPLEIDPPPEILYVEPDVPLTEDTVPVEDAGDVYPLDDES